MAKHNETGIKGEQLAQNFLIKKGFTVLYTNWCSGKKEVDLIAKRDDVLIFVEVKTRASNAFGFPEEAINNKKIGYLKDAAAEFMDANPQYKKIQFDIISILMENDTIKEILHFEDAFY